MQAALALIADFSHGERAAVAILKHNTPCGVGLGDTPAAAYRRAFATDPDSPFGGIVVSSRAFDLDLARAVDEIFTEVLIAPGFEDEALALLRRRRTGASCASTPSACRAPSSTCAACSAACWCRSPIRGSRT